MSDSCSSETVNAKYVRFFENIIFHILSKVSRKNLDPSKKWKGESSGLDSLIQENARRISRLVDDKDIIEKVQIYEDLHRREGHTKMEEARYLRIEDEIFEEFLGHFLYAFDRKGQDYIGFKKKYMPEIICFYLDNDVPQKYIEFVKYVIFYSITSLISESAPRTRLYGGFSDLNGMIIWSAKNIREYMEKDSVRNLFEKFIVLRDNIEIMEDDEFDNYYGFQYQIFSEIFSTFDRMFSSQDITDGCIEHFIPIILSLYKGTEIKSSNKKQ